MLSRAVLSLNGVGLYYNSSFNGLGSLRKLSLNLEALNSSFLIFIHINVAPPVKITVAMQFRPIDFSYMNFPISKIDRDPSCDLKLEFWLPKPPCLKTL